MIRRIIELKLAGEERKLGVSLDYVRAIRDASLGAFLRFVKLLGATDYRKRLSAEELFVARLAAARAADCGSCLETEASLARAAGVPEEVVGALLPGGGGALRPELEEIAAFTRAVLVTDGSADAERDRLREVLRARVGDAGLVELALAIGVGGAFPSIKRALGYSRSCCT